MVKCAAVQRRVPLYPVCSKKLYLVAVVLCAPQLKMLLVSVSMMMLHIRLVIFKTQIMHGSNGLKLYQHPLRKFSGSAHASYITYTALTHKRICCKWAHLHIAAFANKLQWLQGDRPAFIGIRKHLRPFTKFCEF